MGTVAVSNRRWNLGAMSMARTAFAPDPIKLLLLYAVLGILTVHCFGGAKETLNLSSTKKSNVPQPRDCVLSAWSSWSKCDPCQKKRYRFARLEQPSQFNGDPCDYPDKETEDCVTNNPCRNKVRCEGFVCAVTGRCIPQRLRCNGDDDCGDQSDEKNCKKVFKKCDQQMEQYWGIENLAKGLNILTNNLEGLVLDHRYYAGGCSPHYIVDTRFRKPYNVESYIPETKGKYEFTMTEYDSYSSYESSVLKTKASWSSFSFGIKIPGLFELGYSLKDNRFKKFIQRMKRFSSTYGGTPYWGQYGMDLSVVRNSGVFLVAIKLAFASCKEAFPVTRSESSKFIHARSELAVAIYKLKPRALMLHYEFLQRIRQLPVEYSYGEYRELYRDYGTHYITEATIGGIYEYTLVMNSNELQKAGYSLSDVQKCVQHDFNIGGNICGVYVSLGITAAGCKSLLKEIGDSTSKKRFVEDFIALVRGGASEHIATLAYKNLPTATLMQEWGDAVQYNPEIIKLKAEPLYQLVTPTDFANAITIKENLRRALDEFQLETSSCRCAPCHGNGIPFLQGTECECLCPLGYSGTACEISKREEAAINGNWGCWASWSPCSGGQRTRRRQCNNPAPQNGGSSCSGPDAETVPC